MKGWTVNWPEVKYLLVFPLNVLTYVQKLYKKSKFFLTEAVAAHTTLHKRYNTEKTAYPT